MKKKKEKKLKKNPNMVTREIGKELILLPVYKSSEEMSAIYTLNKSAAFVWGLIDGTRTVAEIKNEVLKKFAVTPEEVETEMATLMQDLREIKAVL